MRYYSGTEMQISDLLRKARCLKVRHKSGGSHCSWNRLKKTKISEVFGPFSLQVAGAFFRFLSNTQYAENQVKVIFLHLTNIIFSVVLPCA